MSDRLRDEFTYLYLTQGVEAMAIAAVSSHDSYSVRVFPGYGPDEVEVPVCAIIHALVTDPAYENGWVLAHSHTNGLLTASQSDLRATCALAWVADLMEVPLVDHWLFDPPSDQMMAMSVTMPRVLEPRVSFGY